jgi:glycosyltransferase involved in cell wall biosynthesis
VRICLLTLSYPPASTEGIPRQRQALAHALVRQGHEVYVVTCGRTARTRDDQGATVHEIAVPRTLHYGPRHEALDEPLTRSQALYEGLIALCERAPVDVVDVPLWAAQGFVTHQRYAGATVLWLQTTRAQIMAINGEWASGATDQLLGLERACLERAHGLLADSRAALESVRRDYAAPAATPSAIVYLGLPPLNEPAPARPPRATCEALVVGRLERRKGTALLFDLLPDLLARHPGLTVRFVGGDNSANDGWQARHGATYPASFRARHPELTGRVLFDGYLDDEALLERYRNADMLLAPSLYESFGLIYLEAMRARLPVVAFATGGAAEIFARGAADGAVLAPPGDATAIGQAVGRLVDDAALRQNLGAAGLARFEQAFTAEVMAHDTLQFYEQIIARRTPAAAPRPVYHVMEALVEGDAVSDIARQGARVLGTFGQPPLVLTRSAPASMRGETVPLERALDAPEAALIMHYWSYSTAVWLLRALRGPRALYYHNITPPSFFRRSSPIHGHLARGYAQLARIVNEFDLLLGASRYNLGELRPFLGRPRPAMQIYPVVDPPLVRAAPYDRRLLERLRRSGDMNLLFVGRVAPNKRHDRLMRAFDRYVRDFNPRARLWLVGSDRFDQQYRRELEQVRRGLAAGGRIVFTGKVPEPAMQAYFRGAHLLLCASEHEGFCVPVAQAMAYDVPVLAYAAAALPETLGASPGLLAAWDDAQVAAAIHGVLTDGERRAALLAAQHATLPRFSLEAARERYAAALDFLLRGEQSSLFEQLAPTS